MDADVTHVVLASRRPPFPLDNGARIRTARLVQGLARSLPVTFVTYLPGPTFDGTNATRADLQALMPGVTLELVPYDQPHPRGPRRGVFRRASATMAYADTPNLRATLSRLINRPEAVVLHCDDPGVALAGLAVDGACRRVFAPHNVEHRIVRELAAVAGSTQRPFLEIEWRKIAAEERRLWRGFDLTLAVSEVDAATMRTGDARSVELCPNGADPMPLTPWSPPAETEPARLLFVGTGDYPPYALGLKWFVREVMTRLSGAATLDVVGAPPSDPLQAPGVVYHGRVDDVRPHYETADALVIPVFQGSGTRLKAVESAMAGRPIVSTALGMEGLPLRADAEYLHAEDADGFANAVARLREPATLKLVAAARAAVEPLSWATIADALTDRYRTMTR